MTYRRVNFSCFLGLAFGVTWAYHALWFNLGPFQMVIGRPRGRFTR